MKSNINPLLVLCAILLAPFFSARATTFQVQVGAGGLKFKPANITVAPGDTVQWVWAGDGHSTTSGTPGNPDGLWDSGVQNTGFTFSYTFNIAGTFNYYCTPHGSCCGMIGTVVVAAPTVGAVFVNANSSTNKVWMYNRGSNGQLSFVRSFSTQGSGSANGLGSESSIILTNDHKYLYVVNAASNEISALALKSNGLTFISKVPSGGTFPNSLTIFGSWLYVLNAKGTTNITGFTIQADGSLVAIPNSSRPLSTALPKAGQVGFSPDGSTLVVTENDTSLIDTYTLNADGTSNGPMIQSSAGHKPYGFSFDANGHLVVSEITLSSASSYSITGGILQVITSTLRDNGKVACWAICTHDPSIPQQFAYLSNTGNDTVSGYLISTDGHLTLVGDGRTAKLPQGSFLLDLVISSDSQYLYVLEGKLPGIAAFQIQSDGTLTALPAVTGTPTTSYGLTGY